MEVSGMAAAAAVVAVPPQVPCARNEPLKTTEPDAVASKAQPLDLWTRYAAHLLSLLHSVAHAAPAVMVSSVLNAAPLRALPAPSSLHPAGPVGVVVATVMATVAAAAQLPATSVKPGLHGVHE